MHIPEQLCILRMPADALLHLVEYLSHCEQWLALFSDHAQLSIAIETLKPLSLRSHPATRFTASRKRLFQEEPTVEKYSVVVKYCLLSRCFKEFLHPPFQGLRNLKIFDQAIYDWPPDRLTEDLAIAHVTCLGT